MKLPLLFLLLSVSVVVTAQTPSPQSEADSLRLRDIEEIDVYSTARPSRVSLLALPSLTIGGDELSAPSLFTPADALRREAGIALTRDGIWATSVNIRGLSKERILILSDGERVQTATDIAAALSTIDLNSLERIEVIKGAGSVLYGTGAMGGVVNFVSARPAYTGRMTTSGRVGGGFASANRLWTANAGVQVTDRNWYVGVNGSYRQAQDMRTPAGVIGNSQFEDWSVGVQAGLTYADTQELLLDYQHYEANNVGLPGGASFPAQARVRYRNVQRNLLSGEYVLHEPGVYLRELRVKAYTQNFIRDVENYVEPKKTTILPSSTNVTSGARVLTDWALPSDRHRLKAGAEGWLRDAETVRYNRQEVGEREVLVRREQPVPDATMLDLGLFAQYSWDILPERLTLDAGLRLDYIRTKNDSAFDPVVQFMEINGRPEDEPMDVERSLLYAAGLSHEFSYAAHVDLSYRPARRHRVVLSLSNAYRAASLEERFKYIDQAGTLSVGNPHLKPEQGAFANLSYRFGGDRLRVQADVYANYLFNLITPRLDPAYTTVDGEVTEALVNTNVDRALFLGAEVEAEYWFLPDLWIAANAGYVRGRDVRARAFLPQLPPLKGLAEVNYRLRDWFTATLFVDWAARQAAVAEGESPTDGYATLNLALQSGRIPLHRFYLRGQVGVDNLLNAEYYNHLNTARGIVRAEPGRNFYVKVQVGW